MKSSRQNIVNSIINHEVISNRKKMLSDNNYYQDL